MPLGERGDCGDARYVGVELSFTGLAEPAVDRALSAGFDFVVAPLTSPEYRRKPEDALAPGLLHAPFKRADVMMAPGELNRQVVGKVSPWIAVDAPDAELQRDSEAALAAELAWAGHLSLQACVLPTLDALSANANYARIICQFLEGLSNMALWVTVPLQSAASKAAAQQQPLVAALQELQPMEESYTVDGDSAPPQPSTASCAPHARNASPMAEGGESQAVNGRSDDHDACCNGSSGSSPEWCQLWFQLHALTGYHPRLGILLVVGSELPTASELNLWVGAPVRGLAIDTSSFIRNRKGFPVLPKRHQIFISHFLQMGVQVILTDQRPSAPGEVPREPTPAESMTPAVIAAAAASGVGAGHDLRLEWEYLSYLFRRLPAATTGENAERAYRDLLQSPLQPLQDDLESTTYETFERDGCKYRQYQAAVEAALRDIAQNPAATDSPVVLMVVGAGRGPLIRASILAAASTGHTIRVWAVEKNVNAVVHIEAMIAAEGWGDRVTVVCADMRHWQAPCKADILVSELLGSFGDNELSPECLDGAQRFLRPGGISIPSAYTSQLQPVTASKAWNDVKAYDDLEHFETPFVVKLHRFAALADTQDVFTFVHPNNDIIIDNSRSSHLTFDRTGEPAALCHGLAGYFEARLYGNVHLSIHPPTHTPEMFSWFPIFFPLKEPVQLKAGEKVEAHIWRCIGPTKVWYEWAITSPVTTHIHNTNGRSYHVGL